MEKPIVGRTFCVGDIHGHLNALEECLAAVSFDNESDTLISLGDLVDRGPDSWGVIDRMLKINNLVQIMGNHDEWFLEGLDGYGNQNWIRQGGRETCLSYERVLWKDRERHMQFLRDMKGHHVQDNMAFVHGGFDEKHPLAEQSKHSCAWDRSLVEHMMSCSKGQKLKTFDKFDKIFIGHTPTIYWDISKPINRGGVWNLDTGCGKGGKLTIMNLHTEEYYQTKTTYR